MFYNRTVYERQNEKDFKKYIKKHNEEGAKELFKKVDEVIYKVAKQSKNV